MYLKTIEIQGFKSFPDKTVLHFNKGMTAVVGPNGSGKSNISDAVRWVLGEQSSKTLRSSKMEDVIFSGTSTRRPQGFSEVTLKLDNSEKSLDFDGDTIAVTRRYFRSGESEYLLNGKTVRLKDIHEIFMDTGLGRDGYSMVSQGRIEDIVSSKSNERREMFEEAAGISHFRYRRNDANRRLEHAEENLLRLRDILAELEGRVGPLKEQSRKAEKFIVLAAERKELEIGLWLHNYDKAADNFREYDNRATVVEMQLSETAEALEKIYTAAEQSSLDIRDLNIQADNIRRNASVFEAQAAEIESEIAVSRNSIKHNNETIERIERDKNQEDDTEKHLLERETEAKAKITALEVLIEEKNASLRQTAESLEEILNSKDKFSDELSGFMKEQTEFLSALSEQKITLTSANASMEEIENRVTVIEEGMERKRGEAEEFTRKRDAFFSETEGYKEEIVSLSNSISGLELKQASRAENEEKLRAEFADLKLKAEQKHSRLRLLDDMEKNMEGYTGSVKRLMREAKRGTLRGIHGALSQLINVEGKYSCAIETALGAAIQNIVTDNENDAKRAMYYLRDNNAGRATFLPLSSIRGRELDERGLEACYGYIDIASNLVSADAKYSQIIKSLLGRTLVVEDIDCAIAISKNYSHRFKIVSLDGQVINSGGSMTGGSRVQNSGFLSRSNEMEELRSEIERMKLRAEELAAKHKNAAEELAEVNAVLANTRAELQQVQENLVRSESNLSLAQGQLDDVNAQLSAFIVEQNTACERKKGYFDAIAAAELEIEALSARLKDIEGKIELLGEGQEELLRRKDELAVRSNDVNIEITAIVKDIEAQRETLESLERRKLSHSGRINELNAEIELIKNKNTEIERSITEKESQCAAFKAKADEVRTAVNALVEKREEHEKKATELRSLEREKSELNAKLGQEQVRLSERIEALKAEQESIERKLFEDYQMTRREAGELDIVIESVTKASKRLSELKNSIRALGSVNVAAIDEYKEVSERYEFMSAQINDTEKSKKELEKLIAELTEKMSQRFRERFMVINEKFGECFAQLFNGGSGELVLEDENNILECGIEIKAQPPGKNVKSISLLSGGEKGLCAISLLFAMLKVTPAPFCVFDEVEAALDDVNVTRFADYVRRMSSNTQFILITHRRGTMEEADMLYGVTMQEEGVSKLLELKTAEMAQKLGLET